MSAEGKHVDELTIMRLAEGELSPDREDVTRTHLIECARCRAGYEALKAETELLRAAVHEHDEALPDHIRPRHADISWAVVAMLVFGTLGVTSLWTRYVAPMVDGMESVGLDGASVATGVLIQGLLWKGWTDILMKFVQGTALLAALALAGFILHRSWRRRRSSAAALSLIWIGLGSVFVPAGRATAAVIERDAEIYVLREGEVIETDLIIAGKEVRIEGTIAGDLIVMARLVQVVGEVRGDILGFAERVEVTGRVGGNVRTGSRELLIEGTVARNVSSVGQTLRFAREATLGGSVIAAARDAIFDAPVATDIIVAAKTIEIRSRINGSALIAGESLSIGSDGAIGGAAKYYGPEQAQVDPQAELASPIEFEQIEEEHEHPALAWITALLYFWTAAFIFGAAVMLLLPEASEEIVTKHVPDYGKSFVHGIVSAVILLALGGMITITFVGAPLGLTTLFLLALGLYVAQVFVAAYIGREILGTPTSASAGLLRLALGLFLVLVVKSIPILEFVVPAVIALWGFGAIAAYVRERMRMTAKTAEV